MLPPAIFQRMGSVFLCKCVDNAASGVVREEWVFQLNVISNVYR